MAAKKEKPAKKSTAKKTETKKDYTLEDIQAMVMTPEEIAEKEKEENNMETTLPGTDITMEHIEITGGEDGEEDLNGDFETNDTKSPEDLGDTNEPEAIFKEGQAILDNINEKIQGLDTTLGQYQEPEQIKQYLQDELQKTNEMLEEAQEAEKKAEENFQKAKEKTKQTYDYNRYWSGSRLSGYC